MNSLVVAFDELSVQQEPESKTANDSDDENPSVEEENAYMIAYDHNFKMAPRINRCGFKIQYFRRGKRSYSQRKPYDVENKGHLIKTPSRECIAFGRGRRIGPGRSVSYRWQLTRRNSMCDESSEPDDKDLDTISI